VKNNRTRNAKKNKIEPQNVQILSITTHAALSHIPHYHKGTQNFIINTYKSARPQRRRPQWKLPSPSVEDRKAQP
jgi:hypothetical protein